MTDEELIEQLRGEPTWGGLVALTKQAADRIEALLNLNEALVELMDDRDAKLAKAVEALHNAAFQLDWCQAAREISKEIDAALAAVSETHKIKGESHD